MNKSIIYIISLLFIFFSCKNMKSNDPRNWETGTYTGVLTDFTADQFNLLKSNGIKYIELGTATLIKMAPEERLKWIENIKNLTEVSGVEVWSVHLPYSRTLDVSVTDVQIRENMINECTSIIELCSRLQPKKFIIHPSAEPIEDLEREQRILNSIESLKILNETAQTFNARLTIECLPRTCLGNTSEELLRIVNAVGNNAEICFDSNHLLKEKPEEFISEAGNLITTVHISDYDGLDEKHWLPGKGVINWTSIIRELTKQGYTGPFMFEVVPRNNTGMEISDLTETWKKLLDDYYADINQ